MTELMQKVFDAFASADWQTWNSLHAPDATYEELATRRKVQGHDEIVAVMKAWKTAFPDAKAEILNSYEAGDTQVAEVEWTGTHKGPLESAFGTLQATNTPIRVRAVLISKLDEGKIIESRHYFDLMNLLSTLGVTPGLGAEAPKEAAQPTAH